MATQSLCCDIFNTFQNYIHAENGGDNVECNVNTCTSVIFVDHLKTETNALGQSDLLTKSGLDFEFDKSDTAALASLLVFAYIGRHYTTGRTSGTQEHQHLYFKFHRPTQMLRAVQPHCTFERSVYLSMIIVTVLILIFLLLARHLPKQSRWWPTMQNNFADTTANVRDANVRDGESSNAESDQTVQSANQHNQHNENVQNHYNSQAIDFGGLRRR